MAITKDGGSGKATPVNKKGQAISEYDRYANENQFKGLFHVAINAQNAPQRMEALKGFYKFINENNLSRIHKDNYMYTFLDEFHIFLKSDAFNDDEKRAFMNGCEVKFIQYALDCKKYDIAVAINSLRLNKELDDIIDFIDEKMEQKNYEALDVIFSLDSSITYNCSQILRDFYLNECYDYDYIKSLIHKYKLDINGLGDSYSSYDQWTFAQMVATTEGTRGTEFFKKFMKDFGNEIDFDIQTIPSHGPKNNLLESVLNTEELAPSEILGRFQVILENCPLSVKHIGFLAQVLSSEKHIFVTEHFDHPLYEKLFSHENFNSKLFDREAMLNKLVTMDTDSEIEKVRKENHNTVNPISVILEKFFKYATPPVRLGKHPFITWVEKQKAEFSNDTLNCLVNYYRDDLPNLNLHKHEVRPNMKTALQAVGVPYPEKAGFMSLWFKFRNPHQEKIDQLTAKMVIDTPIKVITKNLFNEGLFEKVKDEQLKKFISSIKLNYEQYQSIAHGGMMNESEHYMSNLLPKFLNTTVENYLHFATLDEKEATENAIVQLKILNNKTFVVLNEELSREQNNLAHQSRVHSKVVQKY